MTCIQIGRDIVICRPSDAFLRKRYQRCPVCECITETVERHEAWYGLHVMCCRCGDSWTDGYLDPRPFSRGWRNTSVREHRALWDRASHGPEPTIDDLLQAPPPWAS